MNLTTKNTKRHEVYFSITLCFLYEDFEKDVSQPLRQANQASETEIRLATKIGRSKTIA